MLRLKKLQILGFKSFCDRTEVKFHGEGIAAIVGPNGCGKSNIADAIAWVLGEQSAKSLRGTRMEDVIFIGTRDRKPMGMAEVSLTFIDPEIYDQPAATRETLPEIEIRDEAEDWDEAVQRAQSAEESERAVAAVQPLGAQEISTESKNSEEAPDEGETEEPHAAEAASEDGKGVVLKIRRRRFKPQQFPAGEIVITRRLFRSGESEYLLNGKLCRLRDIQDLFMGTGLGPESYAIIEQGRIGQILSSKPHDRRAIIEEAAGVTKFKARKRLAEARLEQSKINLARVNDIFDEVTRQMNSLKRQASKAERYARLRDELKQRLRAVLAGRFAQLEQEQQQLAGALAELSNEINSRTENIQQSERGETEHNERLQKLEAEARMQAERINAIALEMERASGRVANNRERLLELQTRQVAAQAERERTASQLASLNADLQSNRAVVENSAAELAAMQSEVETRKLGAQQAAVFAQELEAKQEGRRGEILSTMSLAAEVRNQMARTAEHQAFLQREWNRTDTELKQAQVEIEKFTQTRSQASLEFESRSQMLARLEREIQAAQQELEQRRAAEKECRFRQDSLRAEYATANGRKTSLETMIAQHGYSTESVKRLLQSDARPAFAPAGVLADFLEVDDQYEAVVEDFLRDELNYVVVKSWDAADEGLRLLQSDVDGRATFLVHPEDAQAKFSFIRDERNSASPRRGAILPLKNCIKVLNGFGKSLEVILPKLGNGYITPDRDSAREMALENPNAFFLAPTGETFHNVTVTGGRQRLEGPLSMKRELRELARITSQLEESLRKEEIKRVELARAISELEALGERLQSEGREVEKILLGAGNTLQQLDSELLRARQQLELSQAELARLEGEAVEVAKKLESEKAQEAAHEQSKQRLEREFSEAQKKLLELREKEQVAAREAAEAAAQLAAMEERHHAATASLERIAAMAGECRNRVMALEQEIAAASAEQGQRLSENQQITTQLQSLEASRTDLHRKGEELRQQSLQIKAAMQTLQNGLRELRQQLDGLRDRRGELSSRQAKLESDVAHLSESCLNELNLSRAELLADASIPVLQGEGLAAEETAQRELRARLEAMGPVNMMALEEYNEIAQRHEFLETQRKDLLESIDNTQASIRELDSVTREKFEAAFNRINENFQFTFRKLFGGGQAFMRLTDQENSPDSGIDVIASPPGKKLQNVLLLSGGEKALTALALLVAIFQYQPSPFCLLDEVDAPLDEANVGRFTEMVRELSGTTQFILITHNKRTMSVAPVLYGITMQEQGVSKMVSVRFGEAAQAATA